MSPRLHLKNARIIGALLASVMCLLIACPCSSDSIAAQSMIYKSSGSAVEDGSYLLTQNAYLGTFISVSVPGEVTFTISAKGRSAGGVKPLMHLHVADNKASWSVSDAAYSGYGATFYLPTGTFALRMELANSSSKSGWDRGLYVKSLSVTGAALLNVDSDSNALASADTYIANYRKGPATVRIVDADGNPVPSGITVRARLKRHAFNFGTCVQGSFGDLWWAIPNPPVGSDADKYQKFIDDHFNMITPEACGKWAYQEATRDAEIMDYVEAYLSYAEAHGLRARMHCMLWDYEQSEPAWVTDLKNRALGGDVDAKSRLRDEISERVQYYAKPHAGRFTELDCINETVAHPAFTTIYGIEGVAGIYNETAAAIGGRARVYVNELSALVNYNYAQWYRSHIQSIMDAGGVVQGIGCQTNVDSRYPVPVRVMHRSLQNLCGLELPISTTEYRCTKGGDTVGMMNKVMRLIFGNDMTTGFLMWGFWQNAIYSPNNEVLVNADWTLTPCGVEYERLMALWSTDETMITDADGQVRFTGFHGDYDLTIDGRTYFLRLAKGTSDYRMVLSPVIFDSFDRTDSTALGATEDARHKPWVTGTDETSASVSEKCLHLGSSGTSGVGAGIGDYSTSDIHLSVNLSFAGSSWGWAGVSYRESSPGVASDGYTVRFHGTGTSALLRFQNVNLKMVQINPAIDWLVPHRVDLKAVGSRHEVWVDSGKVIDFTSSSKLAAGCVSLVRSGCSAKFDNLAITQTPPLPVAAIASPDGVKAADDGSLVDLPGLVVSRVFDGFFYAQDANRASGVRVVSPELVSEGDVVSISGMVGSANGEKIINAWSVRVDSFTGGVRPLWMTNAAMGGSVDGYQQAVWNCLPTSGGLMVPSLGLNNIGLCVRICGRVTQIDPAGQYFYMEDGGGLRDGAATLGEENRRVRVQHECPAYVGDSLAVPGVSSCFRGPDDKLRRMLLVAGPDDIQSIR